MTRVIEYTLSAACVSLLCCGCGKQAPRTAAAAQPQAQQAATKPAGEAAPAFAAGRTLADFVDGQTLAFASVPDMAPLAALLRGSPLPALVKNSDFENAVTGFVGAKAWAVLSQEIGRAAQGLLRGRAEAALRSAQDADGRVQIEFYVLWNARDDAERSVRTLADFFVALQERTPELSCGESSLDGVPVRTLTFGRMDRRTCYFAARDGEVRISTDKSFFAPLAPAPHSLRANPEFADVLARVRGEGTPLAFVYAHVGRTIALALQCAASQGAALPPEICAETGVQGFGAAGIAAYRSEGKTKEVGYVAWPEGKRGLLTPFFRKANVRGALAVVPADVGFFSVIGIDLHDVWSRGSALLSKVSPEAHEALRAQSAAVSEAIGTDVPTLLKSLGPDFIVYACESASAFRGAVVLSVQNREVLRGTLQAAEEKLGRRLLRESIDGIPIYALPGPSALHLGLCEQYLVASADIDVVREFVRQRRGRANPLAGRSEVRDFLNYDQLAGMVYIDPAKEYVAASQTVFATLALREDMPAEMVARFGDAARAVPLKMNGIWTLLLLSPEGITGEIRSDCGVLPLALGAGTLGAAVALPAAVQARQDQGEKKVIAAINAIMAGQEEFRIRNSRYAQNLFELKSGGHIDAEIARGACNGYVFKLKSGGDKNWTFDARPMSGHGRFFYCDETGTVRVELDKPAHHESPVAKEPAAP